MYTCLCKGLNQIPQQDYGHKLEGHQLRIIQTTTQEYKPTEFEAPEFSVNENARSNSEVDTDILIEEYED